jgi:hypothetical protein
MFTLTEGLSDIQPVADLFNDVEARVTAMPPKDQRKAADYAKTFGLGGVLLSACEAYDDIKAGPVTIEEVVKLLGAEPGGPIDKLAALVVRVEEQIKS